MVKKAKAHGASRSANQRATPSSPPAPTPSGKSESTAGKENASRGDALPQFMRAGMDLTEGKDLPVPVRPPWVNQTGLANLQYWLTVAVFYTNDVVEKNGKQVLKPRPATGQRGQVMP